MPNYSLVVDATYDPLSYAEISAPIKEAAAYHQALQDSYDKMQLASAMYAPYVKDDPKAKEQYDRYMNFLNNAANTLVSNGAWGQRDMLSQARKSYGEDMLPIETAFKKREEEAKVQAQGKLQGLEFSRNAAASPLSYYFDNPTGGYEIADPKKITSILATTASSFAKQLRSMTPEQRSIFAEQNGLPEWMISTIVEYGWSAQDIMNWSSHPFMVQMMRDALGTVGMTIDDGGNPVANQTWDLPTTQRVMSSVISGFAAGAGEDKVQFHQNAAWEWDQKQKAAAAAAASTLPYYGTVNEDYRTLTDDITDSKHLDELVGSGSKYFVFDKSSETFRASSSRVTSPENGYRFSHTDKGNKSLLLSKDEYYKINKQKEQENISHVASSTAGMDPFFGPAASVSANYSLDNNWAQLVKDAQEAGLTYDSKTGCFMKDGKRATVEDLEDGYNELYNSLVGSRHYLMATGFEYSGTNSAFKNAGAKKIDKFNKDGTYRYSDDTANNGVSVSKIPGIENATILIDGVKGNSKAGIIIEVPSTDPKKRSDFYHISADALNEGSTLKSSIEAYKKAVAARAEWMRKLGYTEDDWNLYKGMDPSVGGIVAIIAGAEMAVQTARNAVIESLGYSNSVSSVSVNPQANSTK